MTGIDVLRAVVRTPSRLVVLLVVGVAIAVAGVVRDASEAGGLVGASQMVGGIAVLIVILGWRRFWRGPAVQRSYQRMMRRRLDRL